MGSSRNLQKKGKVLAVLGFLPVVLSGCGKSIKIGNGQYVEPKDIDPWDYLGDTSITDITAIRDFASSAAGLLVTVGIIGIVFSIFYMIIRLLFSQNSARLKSEIKEEVIFKSVIAIMLFSIPFWLGVVKMVSDFLL